LAVLFLHLLTAQQRFYFGAKFREKAKNRGDYSVTVVLFFWKRIAKFREKIKLEKIRHIWIVLLVI
jgi:hypothetical protein